MFSFAGDTILDPFSGTGSTNLAALMAGRNSIGNEIEDSYLRIAERRLAEAMRQRRFKGAINATMKVDQATKRGSMKAESIVLP